MTTTRPPVPITPDLWVQIRLALGGNDRISRRNLALLSVIYHCGLRLNEALQLQRNDIDIARKQVRVRCGKGKKFRVVAIPDVAIPDLQHVLPNEGWVFVTADGSPILSSYVRAFMARLACRVGVERLHAHGGRHGHALYLASQNVPLNLIRDQLGHSNISTTDRYIARLNPEARVKAINEAYRGAA